MLNDFLLLLAKSLPCEQKYFSISDSVGNVRKVPDISGLPARR